MMFFQKTSRQETIPEPSLRSIHFLKERILKCVGPAIEGFNPWFIDDIDTTSHKNIKNESPVDLIFMGGYLRRFFESGNWPYREYRLWVLSNSVKDSLVQLFKVPENKISVIPRKTLSHVPSRKPFSLLDEKTDLVYAGRLSAQKNIEAIICFFHSLQIKNPTARLFLFGGYDQEGLDHLGRFTSKSYNERICELVSSLKWNSPPVFMGNVEKDEWIRHLYRKPMLVNFSTLIQEDFGVAPLEASEAGWPLMLTNWGGLKDIEGTCYRANAAHIGTVLDAPEIVYVKSESLLNTFLENGPSSKTNSLQTLTCPTPMFIEEIDKIRRDLVKSFGLKSSNLIQQQRLDHFADTDSGRIFFGQLVKSFSITLPEVSIITFDYPYSHFSSNEEREILLELSSLAVKYDVALHLLSSREITSKASLQILSDSKLVLSTGNWRGVDYIRKNIIPDLKVITTTNVKELLVGLNN